MKIKIKKNILEKFIKQISLNGKIETGTIKKVENNLICDIKSGNSIASLNKLNTSAITEISEADDLSLPIKSMSMLLKVIGTFDEYVFLETQDNLLKLYDENRVANIVLASEDYIDNNITEKLPFEYEKSMQLNAEIFKRTLTNMDIVKGETVKVEIKEGMLTVNTGQKGLDNMEEKKKVDYPDCFNELGPISVDVLSILNGEIDVAMKTDYPIRFIMKTDEMETSYYLAGLEGEEDGK